MTEPTLQEIKSWEAKLKDQDFRKLLDKFQGKVYSICEDFRIKSGMLLIRVILPRSGIKSLESVVEKIAKRRKEDPKYSIEQIEDLIGIKILCPYPSSAKAVSKWLCDQIEDFHVIPTKLEEAWVEHQERGYKGYHFTAKPNVGKHAAWLGLNCEIQVKTMCQETWDALTHEINYKRRESIDPEILNHMKQLSNILSAVDEQGEIIKTQIERLEMEDREHKEAAFLQYLYISRDLLEEFKTKYEIILSSYDPREMTIEDLTNIKKGIDEYIKELGYPSQSLCFLATMLALLSKNPGHQEMAIIFAKEYAERNPADPNAEDTRAWVFWAFNLLDKAVQCGESALQKAAASLMDLDKFKNQLCYWVAGATLARKRIRTNLSREVLKFGKELEDKYKDKPDGAKYLDTVGFLRIALGESIEEIEEGLKLVRRALDFAYKSDDQNLIRLADTFSRRHKRIAYLRMAELVRQKHSS